MIVALIALGFLLHILVAPLWMLWLHISPTASKLHLTSHAVALAGWLAIIHVAGAGWHIFTPARWLIWPVVVGLGVLVWRSHKNLAWRPEKKVWPWIKFGIVTLIAVYHVWGVIDVIGAKINPAPSESVALEWPLPQGESWVVHGGDSVAINHHQAVKAQEQALDVVQVQAGRRAKGLLPEALEAYTIYTSPLVAPCTGKVALVQDNLADLTPPQMDRENIAGNHIVLHCKGHSIVLAHLQKGSVMVSLNQEVKAGQKIAKVGNTGNTSEPHLHIHAVQGEHTEMKTLLFEGKGVPMTFEGRYLTRIDTVSPKAD